MSYLEFIHTLVETLDKYFENVVSIPKRCLKLIILKEYYLVIIIS